MDRAGHRLDPDRRTRQEPLAGGAGLYATNPDTGNIHQYNNTPDAWTEIGGPGATFTVSDTQLYGLSPDLTTTTYRWNGTTGTGWTRIGGAADIAQQAQDEKLLAENCKAGRDCVKEYRDAKKLLETSLTDWLKKESLDILIDTFGIDNITKCAHGDLFKCLWAAVDAGSTILGIGAAKKNRETLNATNKFTEKYPDFVKKANEAKKTYDTLRTTIETAEAARENLPTKNEDPQPERGRDDDESSETSCGWVKPGDPDAKNGNRATGVSACLDQEYLNTHTGTDTDTQKVAPPGYRWGQRTAGFLGTDATTNINACHLLGKQLTGSGTDLQNLTTCARGANDWQTGSQQGDNNMKRYENEVRAAVKAEQDVFYQVIPTYSGRRTVPIGFKMFAYGTKPDRSEGIRIEAFVSNTLAGRNLGMFNDQNSNRQIPTGSMD